VSPHGQSGRSPAPGHAGAARQDVDETFPVPDEELIQGQLAAPGRRADTLLSIMQSIEWFTLQRAWAGLTDDELLWEPVPGSWGVHRRSECRTPTPFGDGDWVVDFDFDLVVAAGEGNAIEPMTTVGWLLWHVGSVPERLAQLDFLGGSVSAATGWTSPYLTHHQVFTSAASAVESMQAGWGALKAALLAAPDERLERITRRYTYGSGRPAGGVLVRGTEPGPATPGVAIVAGALHEISHHSTQICMLRDLYRARKVGPLSTPSSQ
jgi:hypothetical protein